MPRHVDVNFIYEIQHRIVAHFQSNDKIFVLAHSQCQANILKSNVNMDIINNIGRMKICTISPM